MTHEGAQIAGSTAASDAARDWEAVRASADIQYAPLPPIKPPETPGWLKSLGEWLNSVLGPIFEPLARFLGMSGKALGYLLIGATALLLLYLIWRIVSSILEKRRAMAKPEAAPEWTPERGEVIALLDDADRLAAEGRFGEATHLLLKRSVHHIAEARPDWLAPASTAREIASLPLLSEKARGAFGAIATRVEWAIFALRDLDQADWTAARAAYADFALQDFGSGMVTA